MLFFKILPPSSTLHVFVVLFSSKVNSEQEAPRGDETEAGVEGVEEPSEDHHGVVEVDTHLEVISGALDATSKIPILVELTLTVFVFDGFVFKTALLDSAAPTVEGGSGSLGTAVESGAITGDEGTTEH